MGKVPEGIYAIIALESLIAEASPPKMRNQANIPFQGNRSPRLAAFVHDVKRFVLYNRSAIEQAPQQVYCSVLVFALRKSLIRERFQEHCMDKTSPEVEKDWNALLQTLEGHSGPVNAVTFSPDGRVLASVSLGQDGQAVGRRVGRGATHARNQYHYQTSLIFRGWDMPSDRQRTAGAPTYNLPVLGWIISVFISIPWVSRGNEKILWLPPEYRPTYSAVHGSRVALSCSSGRVTVMEFVL